MKVKKNIIKDSDFSYSGGSLTYRRSYFVSEIEAPDVLMAALSAEGIPRYGTRDPEFPVALVTDIKGMPVNENGVWFNDAIEVNVTYSCPMYSMTGGIPISLSFGSSSRQVVTDSNRIGDPLLVTYKGKKVTQRAEVTKTIKDDIIVYKRWFLVKNALPTTDYPTAIEKIMITYNGRVNKNTFRGKGPREWMASVSSDTYDLGRTYEVTVQLEHREESWDEWAWYKLYNGEIPRDANKKTENGVKRIKDLYFDAAFELLEDDLKNM